MAATPSESSEKCMREEEDSVNFMGASKLTLQEGRLAYLAIINSLYKIINDMNKPEKSTNDLTNR